MFSKTAGSDNRIKKMQTTNSYVGVCDNGLSYFQFGVFTYAMVAETTHMSVVVRAAPET